MCNLEIGFNNSEEKQARMIFVFRSINDERNLQTIHVHLQWLKGD